MLSVSLKSLAKKPRTCAVTPRICAGAFWASWSRSLVSYPVVVAVDKNETRRMTFDVEANYIIVS